MNKRDIIIIYARDGKEFKGTNYEELVKERDAYEAELDRKELERQERLRKLEEERKAKKEATAKAFKNVVDAVELVNHAVEKYEKETGNKLGFITVNGRLKVEEDCVHISYSPFDVEWWNDMFRFFKNYGLRDYKISF